MKALFLFPVLLAFAFSLTFGNHHEASSLSSSQRSQSDQENSQEKFNFISFEQFESESHKRWETRPQASFKTEKESPEEIRYDEENPFFIRVQELPKANMFLNPKVEDSVSYPTKKSSVDREYDSYDRSDKSKKGNLGNVENETPISNSSVLSEPMTIGILRKEKEREKKVLNNTNNKNFTIIDNEKPRVKFQNQTIIEDEKINTSALVRPILNSDEGNINKTIVTTVTTVLINNKTDLNATTSNLSNSTDAKLDLPTDSVITTTYIVNTTNGTLINEQTNSSTSNASVKEESIISNKSLNDSNSSNLKQNIKLLAIFEKHKGEEVSIVFGCYHNSTELRRDTCEEEKVCEALWEKYKRECELDGNNMVVVDLTGRKEKRHNLLFSN